MIKMVQKTLRLDESVAKTLQENAEKLGYTTENGYLRDLIISDMKQRAKIKRLQNFCRQAKILLSEINITQTATENNEAKRQQIAKQVRHFLQKKKSKDLQNTKHFPTFVVPTKHNSEK